MSKKQFSHYLLLILFLIQYHACLFFNADVKFPSIFFAMQPFIMAFHSSVVINLFLITSIFSSTANGCCIVLGLTNIPSWLYTTDDDLTDQWVCPEKTYQLTKYTEHSNQCKENTIKWKRKASQLGISAQDLAFEFDSYGNNE